MVFVALIIVVLILILATIVVGILVVGGNISHTSKSYFLHENVGLAIKHVINSQFRGIMKFDKITERLSFKKTPVARLATHTRKIDQLAELFAQVRFLTGLNKSGNKPSSRSKLLVIFGSSPGNHLYVLSTMFPDYKFLLVDSGEHIIYYPELQTQYDGLHARDTLYFSTDPDFAINRYDESRIHKSTELISGYQSILKRINETHHIFYILEEAPNDELLKALVEIELLYCNPKSAARLFEQPVLYRDVLIDLATQYYWIKKINPTRASLSFKYPFFISSYIPSGLLGTGSQKDDKILNSGIDFLGNYAQSTFQYLVPESIDLIPFTGLNSTETRFIVSSGANNSGSKVLTHEVAVFNVKDYQKRLYYFNNFEKQYGYHNNEKYFDPVLGIDACGDCDIMLHNLFDYFRSAGKEPTPTLVSDTLKKITGILGIRLVRDEYSHGVFTQPYKNIQEIIEQQTLLTKYEMYRENLAKLWKFTLPDTAQNNK